jgi:hypothetical protein
MEQAKGGILLGRLLLTSAVFKSFLYSDSGLFLTQCSLLLKVSLFLWVVELDVVVSSSSRRLCPSLVCQGCLPLSHLAAALNILLHHPFCFIKDFLYSINLPYTSSKLAVS